MSVLANRLKNLREKRKHVDSKWTQGYAADLIGVARPTYTAYENGTKEPPLSTLNRIADLFDTNLDYLQGRTDDPAPTLSLAEQLINSADKAKLGEGVQEQSADSEKKIGRAFLGGSDQYTEEELDLARAAAKAAVDAYRKAQKKKADK